MSALKKANIGLNRKMLADMAVRDPQVVDHRKVKETDREGRHLRLAALGRVGLLDTHAHLDLAVDGILWSAFGTTGQRCTACSRVIADEPIADELVRRLAERAENLRLGSGLDEAVDVGPLKTSWPPFSPAPMACMAKPSKPPLILKLPSNEHGPPKPLH